MGTWGTGPFDNDGAADMVAGLMANVQKVIDFPTAPPKLQQNRNGRRTSKIASDFYAEARVSIAIIASAAGSDILGGPSLETCLQALVRMSSDDAWLNGWRDPREIRSAIDQQILQVAKAMVRPDKIDSLIEGLRTHKRRVTKEKK